jgi:hypothetical protein
VEKVELPGCMSKVRQHAAVIFNGESSLATARGVVAAFGATLGSLGSAKRDDMLFML